MADLIDDNKFSPVLYDVDLLYADEKNFLFPVPVLILSDSFPDNYGMISFAVFF